MAAAAHLDQLATDRLLAPGPALPPLDVEEVGRDIFTAIDPRTTVAAGVRGRLRGPDTVWTRPDPLAPLNVQPSFPQPMFDALRDTAPHLVFPGLDQIAPDSVVMVAPNTRFIEAFVAGLNHEIGRELLWRGFPVDVRHTFFSRFWDLSAGASADVPPITEWRRALGQNADLATPLLVLLLRGELIRRYPHVVIYAAEAERAETRRPGTRHLLPVFRERIEPDIVLAGFNVSDDQVRGGTAHPGWYFVLEEQPASPRFGFAVDVEPPDPNALAASSGPKGSAHVAAVTMRQPVRVAFHAAAMLPPRS
jgi:hypothetical protein